MERHRDDAACFWGGAVPLLPSLGLAGAVLAALLDPQLIGNGMAISVPLVTSAVAVLFSGVRHRTLRTTASHPSLRHNGVSARAEPTGWDQGPTAESRRYVPGPVANQLMRGLTPKTGESEASVLFADLHGYTRYAESHRPSEVFRLLERFTHGVSAIVQEQGGWIVDFHGDGLLAVFGAPEPLANKERSAVAAAQRIVHLAEQLDETAPLRRNGSSAVTVGIATGTAFVGCIRTVDRLIWSTTGDTTNVAARLQQLTHRFGAPILTDSLTCRRALVDDSLRFRSVQIRGRVGRVDVHAIPTTACNGAARPSTTTAETLGMRECNRIQ